MIATDPVNRAIQEDLYKREQLGLKKYGVTVSDNPLHLKEWLQHAYEEALDLAVYLKRTINELTSRSVTNTISKTDFKLTPIVPINPEMFITLYIECPVCHTNNMVEGVDSGRIYCHRCESLNQPKLSNPEE